MDDKIKVLQIAIGDGSFSGISNFLYSYYSHMKSNIISFDFLYCRKNSLKSLQDNELIARSKIFELNILRENSSLNDYIRLYIRLRQILKNEEYDIVHINTGNIYVQTCCIFAARNIKVRIAHSHSSQSYIHKNNIAKEYLKKILAFPCRSFIVNQATHLLACSVLAGRYLFGETGINSKKFQIVHNAVDTSVYKFNSLYREEIRKSEKILPDTIVFGHVGRLAKVKNHEFLIDVFSEIHRMNQDTVLWIVGDGELRAQIQDKITRMGLNKYVKLFGERNDVNDLLQAIDGFIFPSLFEGLSLVVIEAQNAGLPVYASDNISEEHKLTDLVKFLSLEKGSVFWAEYILNDMLKKDRSDHSSAISLAGYDIHQEAVKLEKFYIDNIRGDKHA